MNKTQLFVNINDTVSSRFNDTYLAPSTFGLFLGFEFINDVSNDYQVGDIIYIDKDNKNINAWVDGTASVIGITQSSIYPAPGTLIFTDRPLQTPIVFSSGEGGVIYKSDNIESNWKEIELSDNIPFPVTFNIADVREITNRNATYTKTISIPGTKNNNDFFKYIFDIQSVDNFDTRKKLKISLVIDTINVLEGYIQLTDIECNDNKYWTYNCNIFGENANFSKEIDQNALLENLNFSDLNHNYNITSVTQSWDKDWNYGYYYPFIDWNSGQKPGTTSLKQTFLLKNLRGCIYAKQYWDRIFENYGYTYESDFLNSNAFKDLIITPNKKFLENDSEWRRISTFRAGLTQSATYSTLYGYQYTSFTPPFTIIQNYSLFQFPGIPENMTNVLQLDEITPPNGDPGNNFVQVSLGEFYYKNVYENTFYKNQNIVLNLDFDLGVEKEDGTPITSNSQLRGSRLIFYCNIYKNNQLISKKTILNLGSNQPASISPIQIGGNDISNNLWDSDYGKAEDWDISNIRRYQTQIVLSNIELGDLQPNDEIRFKLSAINIRQIFDLNTTPFIIQSTNFLENRYNFTFYSTTTYFFNDINTELDNNQPVPASEFVPRNFKQIDFINNIIKMFNLYLYQDKINPKKIFIEPRDVFYKTTFTDWSDKFDISKESRQTPIVERYKRILMSYKDDRDFYNTFYKSKINEIYGQFEFLTGDEISVNEKQIDLIFSPTPLNMYSINDAIYDNSFIYSRIFDPKQPITQENQFKVDSNFRILYRKTIPVSNKNFTIRDRIFGTNYSFNVYPYAGHLNDPINATLDLSFDAPKFLFYKNEYDYINNNLYNEYYKNFFEEIYGPESKIITAYFYLNAQDILDFDYRKLIYVDNLSSGAGGYFRINKIEYDPFNKQSYKTELIKVLNNFRSPNNRLINVIGGGVITDPGAGDGLVVPGNNGNTGIGNIIGGFNNFSNSNYTSISGTDNISIIGNSNILSGSNNIAAGDNNVVLGGNNNKVCSSDSGIITGASNSVSGPKSNIIGGCNNQITGYASDSFIISGRNNIIGLTPSGSTESSSVSNSFIIGGLNNQIYSGTTSSNTDNSIIIGGFSNSIAPGITNSIILNGQNFTATQSNTVYLEGNVLINGNAAATVTPITLNEIAIGTGTGITSNSLFRTTGLTGRSLFIANQSETGSPLASVMMSSVSADLNGANNFILSSSNATMSAGFNGMLNSFNSQIVGSNTSIHRRNIVIGSCNSSLIDTSDVSIISSYGATGGGWFNSIIASGGSQISNSSPNLVVNNVIIASGGSSICDPAIRTAIIASDSSKIDGLTSQRSAIIAGNGLSLAENNTLMTSNLRVDGVVRLANSSGIATITGTGTVTTTLVTATSRIFLTPRESTAFVYYVDNIVPGTSFDISEASGLAPATDISWLIINS